MVCSLCLTLVDSIQGFQQQRLSTTTSKFDLQDSPPRCYDIMGNFFVRRDPSSEAQNLKKWRHYFKPDQTAF
jgi:hypothetical protein